MQFRKKLISCAMLVLCCLSFTSCAAMGAAQEDEEEPKECGRALPPPTHFEANGLYYSELDLETIQNLKLSVESCDGLTELGKIDGGDFPAKDLRDDACSALSIARIRLKNKNDYDAYPTVSTIEKVVYAHPNPDYPNLLVARIDGEPAIFECYGCAKDRKCSIDAMLRDIYGVTAPEKIQAVHIAYYSKLMPEYEAQKTTITDRAELEAFFGAISELSGSGDNKTFAGLEKEYPCYDCELVLENGFSFTITYTEQRELITFAWKQFACNEALAAWLERNAKR